MATKHESAIDLNTHAVFDVPPPPKGERIIIQSNHQLRSKWPTAYDLSGAAAPNRVEGEVSDLVVLGEIPKELDGNFYRVMVDPAVPPHPSNNPLDGDGNISVFQFHDGKVHMKTKYIETERFKLERQAQKSLFGIYRNPFTHHPCVRAAVDSTANTNLVLWAGHLLALKESSLPYAVDPVTLETRTYDPFRQVRAKTFTAHPKYDPFRDELVVNGYEAKGLGTTDVVTYSIDRSGKISNELWFHQPFETPGFIHDCAITTNWLLLNIWPYGASVERMKKGGNHWAFEPSRGATFIIVPRDWDHAKAKGWKSGEVRSYSWKNAVPGHTAGAWEDDAGDIFVETSVIYGIHFPFFPPDGEAPPKPEGPPEGPPKFDYVRWKIDPTKEDRSLLEDPLVVLDFPNEFPRIDERFLTLKYDIVFMTVLIPGMEKSSKESISGFNGLLMYSHKTGKSRWFYAGKDSAVQEPVFVPRSDTAPEGDGWLIALIERQATNLCDVVVLDTRTFEDPIAIVQLPLHLKAQIHGNWFSSEELGGYKPIVRSVPVYGVSHQGALEPL